VLHSGPGHSGPSNQAPQSGDATTAQLVQVEEEEEEEEGEEEEGEKSGRTPAVPRSGCSWREWPSAFCAGGKRCERVATAPTDSDIRRRAGQPTTSQHQGAEQRVAASQAPK